ncbi:hypothetical protein M422DRAFT_268581 [Sphaerobolus stellatus SS14]|uniref:Cytochrome P450 n=1 Tax=Sphaerobolus stellatus (strain SS14) TaxID=990650 RepID=A0A0C9UXW2_SPHS4|nr:hypothetical protein M422DRAFT_268581 [Sphaerobolus stellatus SS14]
MYTFGPLGLPHVPREDDIHDGYYIPKGSVVITNNWHFYQNENIYPNPQKFLPERFTGPGDRQKDPREILFGFGRRICPGIHLADASLWLACASLVAAFDVRPPLKNGSMILRLTYGYKVTINNDPLVRLVGEAMDYFSETIASNTFAVDVFPFLRFVPEWFSGAAWKKKAKPYRQSLMDMVEKPYE